MNEVKWVDDNYDKWNKMSWQLVKFRQRSKGLHYTVLSALNMFEILRKKKNFKTTTDIKTQPCLYVACYSLYISRKSALQPPWRLQFFFAAVAVFSVPFLHRLLSKPSPLPALYQEYLTCEFTDELQMMYIPAEMSPLCTYAAAHFLGARLMTFFRLSRIHDSRLRTPSLHAVLNHHSHGFFLGLHAHVSSMTSVSQLWPVLQTLSIRVSVLYLHRHLKQNTFGGWFYRWPNCSSCQIRLN